MSDVAAEEGSSFMVGLVFAAIETSLNVFIMMAVGVILAHPEIALITKPILGGVAKIWLKIILPFFLFGKFSQFNVETIFSSLSGVFFALFMIFVQLCISFALFTDWKGLFFGSKKPKEEGKVAPPKFVPRNLMKLVCAFQSAFVLPYPYVVSFTESDTIFKDPAREELGLTFLSLYSFPVLLVFFSFGLWYGGKEKDNKIEYNEKYGIEEDFGGVQQQSLSEMSFFRKVWTIVQRAYSIFPPSVYAMVLGLAITFISPIKQNVFVDPPPVVAVVRKVVNSWTNAMSPLAFLIIGGNVGQLLFPAKKEGEPENKPKKNIFQVIYKKIFHFNHPYHLIAGVGGKMILIPVITFILIVAIGKILPEILMPTVMYRPIFYSVLMIEACVPCMLATIVVANSVGVGVSEISEIVLWQYLLSPFLTVIFGIIFIYTFCSMESEACYM